MSNDLVRLFVIVAVAYVAYTVLSKDNTEAFTDEEQPTTQDHLPPYALSHEESTQAQVSKTVKNSQLDDVYNNNTNVLPHPQMSNSYAPQGNFESSGSQNLMHLDCYPKDQLVASDLLPPEGGFSESNPAVQGQLMNRNLFESAHHAGLNTQSNTLKNANRQLRSDPVIERRDVGPWMQSTYESDTNRRTFEIGMV